MHALWKGLLPSKAKSDSKRVSIAKSALFNLRDEVHAFLASARDMCAHMAAIGDNLNTSLGVADGMLGADDDAAAAGCAYARGTAQLEACMAALERGVLAHVLVPLENVLGPQSAAKRDAAGISSPSNSAAQSNGAHGVGTAGGLGLLTPRSSGHVHTPGVAASLEEYLDSHRRALLGVLKDMLELQVTFLSAATQRLLVVVDASSAVTVDVKAGLPSTPQAAAALLARTPGQRPKSAVETEGAAPGWEGGPVDWQSPMPLVRRRRRSSSDSGAVSEDEWAGFSAARQASISSRGRSRSFVSAAGAAAATAQPQAPLPPSPPRYRRRPHRSCSASGDGGSAVNGAPPLSRRALPPALPRRRLSTLDSSDGAGVRALSSPPALHRRSGAAAAAARTFDYGASPLRMELGSGREETGALLTIAASPAVSNASPGDSRARAATAYDAAAAAGAAAAALMAEHEAAAAGADAAAARADVVALPAAAAALDDEEQLQLRDGADRTALPLQLLGGSGGAAAAARALAAASPLLDLADLCTAARVCARWRRIVANSSPLLVARLRAGALPPQRRAALYIQILFSRPAWLGAAPCAAAAATPRGGAAAAAAGCVSGVYAQLCAEADAIACAAAAAGDGGNGGAAAAGSDGGSGGGSSGSAAAALDQAQQQVWASFKVIEADLARTRPALLPRGTHRGSGTTADISVGSAGSSSVGSAGGGGDGSADEAGHFDVGSGGGSGSSALRAGYMEEAAAAEFGVFGGGDGDCAGGATGDSAHQTELRCRLRRVLRAFAVRWRRVSYCQGMNFVGLALLEAAGGDEETAFWALVGISDRLGMEGVWAPGLHRLEFALFALERLLKTHAPDLTSHLAVVGVSLGMFASRWFITLFQCHDTFGRTAAARVLDLFVAERWPALLRVAAAVLIELAPQLTPLPMEGVLRAMRCPRALLFGASPARARRRASAIAADDSLAEVLRADALLARSRAIPCDAALLRELEAEFYLGDAGAAAAVRAAAAAGDAAAATAPAVLATPEAASRVGGGGGSGGLAFFGR